MFIDMHVHPAFYEPIQAEPEREELRHQTLNIYKNGTALLEHVFHQMKCAGLDRLCLLPQDYHTLQGGQVLVSNEEIKRLVDMAPNYFIGFASVDPHDPHAPEQLERAFTYLHLRGLKLHPGRQHFYPSDGIAEPLYEICEKYDKPIIFHSGLSWEDDTFTKYCRPDVFEKTAAAHPKLRMCLAHFGWPWCRETAMLMLKYPNVYTDTGALYFDCAREFY